MFFKKKEVKDIKIKYIDEKVCHSHTIVPEDLKYFNKNTKKVDHLYSEIKDDPSYANISIRFTMCELLNNAIASEIMNQYKSDVVIILNGNTMKFYIHNESYIPKNMDMLFSDTPEIIENILNPQFIVFKYVIRSKDMMWFDIARFNAFMRVIGNIDFPVVED